MNMEVLLRWLPVATNIGILAGLILVAVELNQTAKLARAEFITDGNNVANQIYASMIGENPLAAVARSFECPERLDFEDFVVLDTYLFTMFNNFYRNYQLAQEGLYSDEDWKNPIGQLAHWLLKYPFGRAWWEKDGKQFFAVEFAEHIDKVLEKDGRSVYEYWGAIRPAVVPVEKLEHVVSRACEE